ncbi:MAG: GIY-YIG nuclease family protein [bacterium]|nr:MAG: GIY-YIG nuclease family protein [bacterium]
MSAYLYILRLKSGNLYIGTTMNLGQRIQEHFEGRACRTTSLDSPLILLSEKHETFSEARRREDRIKRWTRAKKEAFVSGDFESLKKLAKSREDQK